MQVSLSGKQFAIGASLCGRIETLIRRAAENWQPVMIAETTTRIESPKVEPTLMPLELANASLLMFRNAVHGGFNVVFRRADENIGWINPRGTEKG